MSRDGRRGPVQNGIVFRAGSLDRNPAAVPKRSGEGCGTAALTGTCGEDSPAGLLQAAATNSSEGTGQGGELGGGQVLHLRERCHYLGFDDGGL